MCYGGSKKLFVNNITMLPIKKALTTLPDILTGKQKRNI
jgi:hypothetical protein